MYEVNVILHPTDFSDDSEQAFELACGIARSQFAKLIVVHVIPGTSLEAADGTLQEDLPEIIHCREQFQHLRALAGDVPVSFHIAQGHPVDMIQKLAIDENAELIVIASHRHTQFHLQLHGSVAEGLLRQAHCPVLCLRQPTPGIRNVCGSSYKATNT